MQTQNHFAIVRDHCNPGTNERAAFSAFPLKFGRQVPGLRTLGRHLGKLPILHRAASLHSDRGGPMSPVRNQSPENRSLRRIFTSFRGPAHDESEKQGSACDGLCAIAARFGLLGASVVVNYTASEEQAEETVPNRTCRVNGDGRPSRCLQSRRHLQAWSRIVSLRFWATQVWSSRSDCSTWTSTILTKPARHKPIWGPATIICARMFRGTGLSLQDGYEKRYAVFQPTRRSDTITQSKAGR